MEKIGYGLVEGHVVQVPVEPREKWWLCDLFAELKAVDDATRGGKIEEGFAAARLLNAKGGVAVNYATVAPNFAEKGWTRWLDYQPAKLAGFRAKDRAASEKLFVDIAEAGEPFIVCSLCFLGDYGLSGASGAGTLAWKVDEWRGVVEFPVFADFYEQAYRSGVKFPAEDFPLLRPAT